MQQRPRGPDRARLRAAYGAVVPDLVRPGLAVLLCGINPSLVSGVRGLHFANPTNRLWPALHMSGWTPRRLQPDETDALLAAGLGVTNLVPRATARADELDDDERTAQVGEQQRRLGPAGVWLLPNPTGLNASWQVPRLAEAYAALRRAARPGATSR